ncbi:MazG family protein [Solicola gregarius]|uniref:MazG family protein n=1 Tax=Solicola gregarius TaxID=2908642 RepID=A0AA46TK11_9ACTN|nr:MazG family protein [Solicola gregarius]UYM06515.1 MazG family protein [Solicola gregarius]
MPLRALITSAAVPPGTLTLEAWDALRAAALVVPADPDDPTALAVRESGIALAASAEPPGDDLPERLARLGGDAVWLAPRGEVDASGLPAIVGSADPYGGALVRLVSVMERLRRQCPWDAEQTHESLATYLLEETYETLEALDDGDSDLLREELGDLLLQVYFHAEIAAEVDEWTVDDVAQGLIDKLVRRHPHVFAGVDVRHAADVEANWDRLKATEKRRDSVLDGVPAALPALAYADKVVTRLRRAGVLEATNAPAGDPDDDESRVGRELLETVLAARSENVDAERALRRATRELARRAER